MATFVLVHGWWRGGWTFQGVRRDLQSRGHEVFAPSLTGTGERAHLVGAVTGLDTWADDVALLLEAEDLTDVILVGHSFGGVIITAAAERVATRIKRLVFLDAAEPRDGERPLDLVPQEIQARFPPMDPLALLRPFPLRAGHGIDESKAAWANARLSPMPARPGLDPVPRKNPHARALPRSYVFAAISNEILPAFHLRKRLEAEGTPFEVFDAAHDFPFSHPAEVAALLERLAAIS